MLLIGRLLVANVLGTSEDVLHGAMSNMGDALAQVQFMDIVDGLRATMKPAVLHVISKAPSPGDTCPRNERANDRVGRIVRLHR